MTPSRTSAGVVTRMTRRKSGERWTRSSCSNSRMTRPPVDATGRRRFLQRKLGLQIDIGAQCSSSWFRYDQRIEVSVPIQIAKLDSSGRGNSKSLTAVRKMAAAVVEPNSIGLAGGVPATVSD